MTATIQPVHHVPDEELVEHVAGTTTAPARLAVACHVALCPTCASVAAELEAVGGGVLATGGAEALARGALAETLARLDRAPLSPAEARTAASLPEVPPLLAPFALPPPLRRALAAPGVTAAWRFVVPGVRAIALPAHAGDTSGTTVRLVAFQAGTTIPHHDHAGPEHIVVFSGALEEEGKRFTRGDISIRGSGERHQQQIAPGEVCVALVVNEGRLLPLTLRGRILLALSRG